MSYCVFCVSFLLRVKRITDVLTGVFCGFVYLKSSCCTRSLVTFGEESLAVFRLNT